LIDPVGFGFEEFDGIGAFRSTENGQPIDDRGALFGTLDIDGDFRGASELSERLITSKQFQDCVVRQMFRFAMGQAESSDDQLALLSISSRFSSDSRLSDLALSFVESPLFLQRIAEGN
jgi:hypothetical protein